MTVANGKHVSPTTPQVSEPRAASSEVEPPPSAASEPDHRPLSGPLPSHDVATTAPFPSAALPPTADPAATSAPSSPYTANRQLTHALTLPPIPNVEVPPSPPGSPSPAASRKVARFLDLKAQGVHFNARLAGSSQLRNPSLLQNLMRFAGIDEGAGQYASTLDDACKPVPAGGFPEWAYEERLGKAQAELTKRRLREREGVDFVPSNGAGPARGVGQADASAVRDLTGVAGEAEGSSKDTKDKAKGTTHLPSTVGGGRSRFDERERDAKRRRER